MTQQQAPTQLSQTFPAKTEGLTTAAILTTANASVSLPATGLISAQTQNTSSAGQATTPTQSNMTITAAAIPKNDPKAVEQSVAKLKQFLKNLVKLAEGRKKEVQDKVQSHVQRLLAGSLSEEQFAENLEHDLSSPHQPNLLPFLKSSVPHLRATLLQQRLLMDKQQQLLDLEKQKVAAAALLMNQTQAAAAAAVSVSLNNSMVKPTVTAANLKPVTTTATAATTAVATAAATNITAAAPSLNLQSLLQNISVEKQQQIFQNISAEKQQQLLQQRQALQQLLQKQQAVAQAAQLKKEALEAVTAITAANEPDIQITGVTRQTKSNVTSQSLSLSSQLAKAIVSSSTGSSNNLLSSSTSRFSINKPISSLANGTASVSTGNSPSSAAAKLQEIKLKAKTTMRVKSKKELAFGDNSDDEDEEMEVAGVNLQEEAVHFLPPTVVESDTGDKKIEDVFLLHKEALRQKILEIGRRHGVTTASDEALSLVSHATEMRLKNILTKLAVISQHRTEVLKDDSHYEITSQVREQLKFLEGIDRVHTKRKQEQEREKLLKAAKSKSKSDDPNLISIKEQAKKLQMEEEEQIRKRAANETALSAIGSRRKRPAPNSSESQLSSATGSSLGVLTGSQPKHKRRVAIRDLVFLMEQERETRKSPLLYKTLMK